MRFTGEKEAASVPRVGAVALNGNAGGEAAGKRQRMRDGRGLHVVTGLMLLYCADTKSRQALNYEGKEIGV